MSLNETTWGLSTNQLYSIQCRVYMYTIVCILSYLYLQKYFYIFYTRCISVIQCGCCITLGRTGNWNTSRPLPTGKLRTLRPMSWSQLPLGKDEFVATTFLGTWDFHFYRVILWTRYLGIFMIQHLRTPQSGQFACVLWGFVCEGWRKKSYQIRSWRMGSYWKMFGKVPLLQCCCKVRWSKWYHDSMM